MLLTRPSEKQNANFKIDLDALFNMSNLGHLHHYLDIEFKQVDGGIALCQTKYIQTLLYRFVLKDCKPIATLMETCLKLRLYEDGDCVDITLYQQVIGCLVNTYITRPDIQFSILKVTKFMHSLGSIHWKKMKSIF